MEKSSKYLIHASNVNGLGARMVVSSFIHSFSKTFLNMHTTIVIPYDSYPEYRNTLNVKIVKYKRFLPNSVSRVIECLFAPLFFNRKSKLIVLGDIPLFGIYDQVVLVHQSNLVDPKVNPNSGNSFVFKINRFIFRFNLRFVKQFFVQTNVMKEELIASYPEITKRISVVPQPVPDSILPSKIPLSKKSINKNLKLFYPSAHYPHKNHQFLLKIAKIFNNKSPDFVLYLTLSELEFEKYRPLPFLKNLGRLTPREMNEFYTKCDALVFLSKAESFGLPLIEAMAFELPILTIDLPYSRWVCEDKAIYFEPDNIDSFYSGFANLKKFIKSGSTVNYEKPLSKFPSSWNEVVSEFMNHF